MGKDFRSKTTISACLTINITLEMLCNLFYEGAKEWNSSKEKKIKLFLKGGIGGKCLTHLLLEDNKMNK